jgi:hypothetical protein
MTLLPDNAQCPVCGGYDGWVGARLPEKDRCKCPPSEPWTEVRPDPLREIGEAA